MVRVAKTLDVPIKILWPKSGIFSNDYMLLGLGDIVIPGAFITLALRRDLFASPSRDSSKAFKKPYFRATIFAYVLGLATTMYVLHSRQAAQPALLYLRLVGQILNCATLTGLPLVRLAFYPSSLPL